jgi:hypothetical protein
VLASLIAVWVKKCYGEIIPNVSVIPQRPQRMARYSLQIQEQQSLLQNYKNAVTPAEAGVQKPLTSLDSCFRRNDRKKQV